jgi:predicted GIY-YIG superfamily endonuclease
MRDRRRDEMVKRNRVALARHRADHWCYRAYDADGRLLYVGISSDGLRRFKQHRRDKPWTPFVAEIRVEHFATREEAMQRERELVLAERPPYNRLVPPIVETLPTPDAPKLRRVK